MPDAAVNVLIASPLEAELATAVEAAGNLRRWLDGWPLLTLFRRTGGY